MHNDTREQQSFDVAIIGGGILGASISYFLASKSRSRIILVEQEETAASHTSSRNTGKVHAPFFYDPLKKKHSAKAAFLGFDMLKTYCNAKSLPFKQDGVLEVATYDKGIDRLHEYVEWGLENGLTKDELHFLERADVLRLEPNVECLCAIHCTRDGSVDYGAIAKSMIEDAKKMGCHASLNTRVRKIVTANNSSNDDGGGRMANGKASLSILTDKGTIHSDFVINTAGGNAIDIAHSLGAANDYTDFHFRGEYWRAPTQYDNLTKISVYSVPRYPDYPFLDPHWIVRADGRREVGPNAVPVSGPYAYNWTANLKSFIPKALESFGTGAQKILFDRQFLTLAFNEVRSSLSKTAMINRAKEFLPQLRPSAFSQRGTAGIRSSLISKEGKFVPDTLMIWQKDFALHVLNYNSPGATGAMPTGAKIANHLIEKGIVVAKKKNSDHDNYKMPWDIARIADEMDLP